MAAPVLVGIGAGGVAASPALAAAATTIAVNAAVAALYGKLCAGMIEVHRLHNCREAGWFNLNCATIRTVTAANCVILAGAVGTIIVASGGVLSELPNRMQRPLKNLPSQG